jgi:hypothetical protein
LVVFLVNEVENQRLELEGPGMAGQDRFDWSGLALAAKLPDFQDQAAPGRQNSGRPDLLLLS